ncbi:MAG: hypothetical protein AAGD18_07335 [Actinomycetota bacterium]
MDRHGVHTISFDFGRCYGDPTRITVDETDEQIRIDVSGRSNRDNDCAFAGEVRLDAPLGDRVVLLLDAGDTYRRCERGAPPTGDDAPLGTSQTLCTGETTTAQTWVTPTTQPPVPVTNLRIATLGDATDPANSVCGPNLVLLGDVPDGSAGQIALIIPVTGLIDPEPGDLWDADVAEAVLWRWDGDPTGAGLVDQPICVDPGPRTEIVPVRIDLTGTTGDDGALVVEAAIVRDIAGHSLDAPAVLDGPVAVRP